MRDAGGHLADGGEAIGALHLLLEALRLGDVLEDRHGALDVAVGVADQAGVEQDRDRRAVLAADDRLAAPAAAQQGLLELFERLRQVAGHLEARRGR